MKVYFLGIGLLFSASISASQVEIKNFSFNYQDPSGKGVAENFDFKLKRILAPSEILVEKVNRNFIFKSSGTINQEFVLENAPDIMLDAQKMFIKKLNLNLNSKFDFSIEAGSFTSPEDDLQLSRLNLSCSRELKENKIENQVIQGCVSQLKLTTSNLHSKSFALNNLISNLFDDSQTIKRPSVNVENVDLKVSSGKYELSAMVKAQISGKLKSSGNVTYESSKKLMAIKISEVKFTFLDITDEVFDELKKNESEKMKVKKPYIYLSLSE